MAKKSYKKEWKIARWALVISVILGLGPFIILFFTDIISSDYPGVQYFAAIVGFFGIILIGVSFVYFLVLAVYVQFDERRVAKLSDKLVPAPGIKLRQRTLLATISFAIVYAIMYYYSRMPEYFLQTVILVLGALTAVLYIVHFVGKRRRRK